MLIVGDIHIGKAAHFRNHGVAIHKNVNRNNLWKLSGAIDAYAPKNLVVLGDLSHSRRNKEWDEFVDFREMYPKQNWILVDGNHDLLDPELYDKAGIDRVDELSIAGITMVHDREQITEQVEDYILSAHVHPAVRVRGKGRQSLRLDCFYFSENEGLIPAFGEFTGRYTVKVQEGDRVFVIAGNEVVELA